MNPLPGPNPKVAARIINGEAMILTPHDSVLHTLNPVATRVWELLKVHRELPALVSAVVDEFEIDQETAEADIKELVEALVEKKILE
jgi:hypothetical protein